jgi:hypothetical protein
MVEVSRVEVEVEDGVVKFARARAHRVHEQIRYVKLTCPCAKPAAQLNTVASRSAEASAQAASTINARRLSLTGQSSCLFAQGPLSYTSYIAIMYDGLL